MSQYEGKNSMKKDNKEQKQHNELIKWENEAKRLFITKKQLSFQTAQVLLHGHFKQPHHFYNKNNGKLF